MLQKLKDRYYNSRLPYYSKKLHLSETISIAACFLMGEFSLLSYSRTGDQSLHHNALFFFALLGVRLILFFWNLATQHRSYAKISQAIIMLVTAVFLYFVRQLIASNVSQNVLSAGTRMVFPDHWLMTIAYGLYTIYKIILWIFGIIHNQNTNRYLETLSYLGWFSTLYSMAVCVSYILYTGEQAAGRSMIPMKIIFWVTLFSTVLIIIVMIVKAVRSLYLIYKERKNATPR